MLCHANYTYLRICYLFLSPLLLFHSLCLSHSEFSNKNCALAPRSERLNWLQKETCMMSSAGTLFGTRSKTTWLTKRGKRNENSKASIYNYGNWNSELCSGPGNYIRKQSVHPWMATGNKNRVNQALLLSGTLSSMIFLRTLSSWHGTCVRNTAKSLMPKISRIELSPFCLLTAWCWIRHPRFLTFSFLTYTMVKPLHVY